MSLNKKKGISRTPLEDDLKALILAFCRSICTLIIQEIENVPIMCLDGAGHRFKGAQAAIFDRIVLQCDFLKACSLDLQLLKIVPNPVASR